MFAFGLSCSCRFDAEHSEEEIKQAWPHRCCYVVKELLVTERVYVQALGDIIKVRVYTNNCHF